MKKIMCMILLASSGWLMAQTSKTIVTIHGEKIPLDEKMTTDERDFKYDANNRPPVGTMIYNTITKCHEFYTGTNGDWYNYCWGGVTDPGALAITTQPTASAAVCSGSGTQTMEVVATGATTYQWKKVGGNIINDGGVFSGATTAMLTLTNPTVADAVAYEVIVGNGTTTVTSNPVTAMINATPTILTAPTVYRVGSGTVVLNATASAGATIDWYDQPSGGTRLIEGSNSFTTPPLTATKTYYVEAVSGCGTSARTPIIGDVGTTEVVQVTSTATGRVWMDRNLGATSTSGYEAYGSLYQWGRGNDGHQLIDWDSATSGIPQNGTTSTRSTTDTPIDSRFITTGFGIYDWRSTPNNNRWQGVDGVNNPCPTGYRLPTANEFALESLNSIAEAAASPLKIPPAGCRVGITGLNGNLQDTGTIIGVWTSDTRGVVAEILYITGSGSAGNVPAHTSGYSVRCIKHQ